MKVNKYSDGSTEQQVEQRLKYNINDLSLGYGKSYKSPKTTFDIDLASDIEYFENTGYSFGVNNNLSISY